MMFRSALLGILFLALGCCGCSRPLELAEVSGQVTLGGEALEQVVVSFVPDSQAEQAPKSSAVTGTDGRYRLHCSRGGSGAVVGAHRILIEDLRPYSNPRNDNSDKAPARIVSRVPERYKTLTTTPLKREVTRDPQTIDLEIES